jgi:hypothetical protein
MFHPVWYVPLQGVVATTTIHCTQKKSLVRPVSAAIVIWLAYLEFSSATDPDSGYKNNFVINASCFYTAQLVNLLWLNQVSWDGLKEPSLKLVVKLIAFNMRGINTPWQPVKAIPFPLYYRAHIPLSRVRFLIRQIAVLMFQYVAVFVFQIQVSKLTPELKDRFMPPGSEFNYLRGTWEQLLFRIVFCSITRWIAMRSFLSSLYTLSSILGVGSGIYTVEDFPPFMGSMWSAYTIRNYWGYGSYVQHVFQ